MESSLIVIIIFKMKERNKEKNFINKWAYEMMMK